MSYMNDVLNKGNSSFKMKVPVSMDKSISVIGVRKGQAFRNCLEQVFFETC